MKYWFLLLIAGLVAIAGGVLALANPLAATLTANVLVGAMFILFGALTLFAAGWDHRFWTALLGALGVLIGIGILNNPLESVLTMTLVLAVLFLVEGATKMILSFSTRGTPYFWMLMLSGADLAGPGRHDPVELPGLGHVDPGSAAGDRTDLDRRVDGRAVAACTPRRQRDGGVGLTADRRP